MNRVLRSIGSVGWLLALEVAAIVLLHRLGDNAVLRLPVGDLSGWLETATFDQLLGASLRIAALVLAYWLLASTVLYTIAVITQVPQAIRATQWMTLPVIRRAIDRGLAVGLATSTFVGGGAQIAHAVTAPVQRPDAVVQMVGAEDTIPTPGTGASATPAAASTPLDIINLPGEPTATTAAETTTTSPNDEGTFEDLLPDFGAEQENTTTQAPTTGAPTTGAPTTRPSPSTTATVATPGTGGGLLPMTPPTTKPAATTPTTEAPATTAPGQATPATPGTQQPAQVLGEQVHLVVSGESLWSIAENQLRAGGGDPSEGEIASYWVKVVDANRDNLRSGDPDLIYPGESITLPAV